MDILSDPTLIGLEVQEYLQKPESTKVKNNLIDYSTWFDREIRTNFLRCADNEDRKEYIYLLNRLNTQINLAILTLNKPRKVKKQIYECAQCEKSFLRLDRETCDDVLNHQHFEELYSKFLSRGTDMKGSSHNSSETSTPRRKVNGNVHHPENFTSSSTSESEGAFCSISTEGLTQPNIRREWYSPNILDRTNDSIQSTSSGPLSPQKICNAFNRLGNVNQKSTNTKTDEYQGKNDFRFDFQCKYDPIVEPLLYPKFHQHFKIDGYFILQRTGVHRVICLICNCELLHQRTVNAIMSHTTGTRHSKNITKPELIASLKNYHDIFYKMDLDMQAHQVYFTTTENPSMLSCELCNLYVRSHDVVSHIHNHPHKAYVLALRKDPSIKQFIYLLEYQLRVYGIEIEVVNNVQEKKPAETTPKTERKPRRVERYLEIKVHQIVKSVENPSNNSDPLDNLPRRFEEHKKYFERKGKFFKCKICEKGKNEIVDGNIQFHIIQSTHMNSAGLATPDYLYFCEVCNMKFHDEIGWQVHFSKGPNKHDTLDGSQEILEYECLNCNVIIYGDEICLKRHKHCFTRRIDKPKNIVLNGEVKKHFGSNSTIRKNGKMLLEGARYVNESYGNIVKCCKDIENALSVKFPSCAAYPFGSRESGLGSKSSDLDVFIDTGGMYNGVNGQDEKSQIQIITTSIELFQKRRGEFTKINSRPTARTPIIKLKHIPTGLECDLSFRHGLSVENTKFLKVCFLLQPVSQELILLLKKWSHLCGLKENITTYAFAMMAIFYLQTKEYLISVKKLKELTPKSDVIIDGWETIAYNTSIRDLQNHLNPFRGDVVDLLKGFFKYYAEFHYKTDVVCPLMGETILKSQFTEDMTGSKLPKEMSTYVKKINQSSNSEYFRALSEFCIQDPFDLSHNLTKACSTFVVEKFKKLCLLSYEMMSQFTD